MSERSQKPVVVSGHLRRGDTKLPVQVAYASRFSLYASVIGPGNIPFHEEFDEVVLNASRGDTSFGRCIFQPIGDGEGFTGRLVFQDDAYNFSGFFQDEGLTSLDSRLHKLALVLNQDKVIRPEFREYVSNLLYRLNAHKAFYDSLDRELEGEPAAVKQAAQEAVLNREGPKFFAVFNEGLEELKRQTAGFTREENAIHGSYLRKQCWHLINESAFLLRTNTRPRGYAGDSEMMRMIYANAFEGNSLLGKLLHKHPIETAAAQAVRNRRGLIANVLRAMGLSRDSKLRVMSVACGPAYEVSDLLQSRSDLNRNVITLLDQDMDALSEAARNISQVEATHHARAQVSYLNESVRTMLRTPQVMESWGKFDFIYSMGLFDYLTEPVARSVGRRLFDMLNPGGTLLIGNYHVGTPTRLYMEYWMDWVLTYRTEGEMLALLEDHPNAQCSVGFEGSGAQLFLKVVRQR